MTLKYFYTLIMKISPWLLSLHGLIQSNMCRGWINKKCFQLKRNKKTKQNRKGSKAFAQCFQMFAFDQAI